MHFNCKIVHIRHSLNFSVKVFGLVHSFTAAFIQLYCSTMAEVVVFSSSKDSCGLGVLDVATGSSVASSFKNCIADAGTMCTVGSSESSYSGRGSGGDFIAVSQSKKPLIHVWQWGKPQPFLQCHVQEIVTALGSDSTGTFLIGGTQKGWIHCWNTATGELVNMWQAHFREVKRIYVTKNNQYIVSSSEDGGTRVWETSKVLDISERLKTGTIKGNILPFRLVVCCSVRV